MQHLTKSNPPFHMVANIVFENEHEMMVVAAYLWECTELIHAVLTEMDYEV